MHVLEHCAYLTSASVGIADVAFVCHRNSATDGPQKHGFQNARQQLPWCGSYPQSRPRSIAQARWSHKVASYLMCLAQCWIKAVKVFGASEIMHTFFSTPSFMGLSKPCAHSLLACSTCSARK